MSGTTQPGSSGRCTKCQPTLPTTRHAGVDVRTVWPPAREKHGVLARHGLQKATLSTAIRLCETDGTDLQPAEAARATEDSGSDRIETALQVRGQRTRAAPAGINPSSPQSSGSRVIVQGRSSPGGNTGIPVDPRRKARQSGLVPLTLHPRPWSPALWVVSDKLYHKNSQQITPSLAFAAMAHQGPERLCRCSGSGRNVSERHCRGLAMSDRTIPRSPTFTTMSTSPPPAPRISWATSRSDLATREPREAPLGMCYPQ